MNKIKKQKGRGKGLGKGRGRGRGRGGPQGPGRGRGPRTPGRGRGGKRKQMEAEELPIDTERVDCLDEAPVIHGSDEPKNYGAAVLGGVEENHRASVLGGIEELAIREAEEGGAERLAGPGDPGDPAGDPDQDPEVERPARRGRGKNNGNTFSGRVRPQKAKPALWFDSIRLAFIEVLEPQMSSSSKYQDYMIRHVSYHRCIIMVIVHAVRMPSLSQARCENMSQQCNHRSCAKTSTGHRLGSLWNSS